MPGSPQKANIANASIHCHEIRLIIRMEFPPLAQESLQRDGLYTFRLYGATKKSEGPPKMKLNHAVCKEELLGL